MQTQSSQSTESAQSQPIQITKYLKGADFPASKDDLLECAESNDAPEEVVEAIQALSADSFESITDVTQADSGTRRTENDDDEE